MRIRVQRNVAAQLIGKLRKPIDAKVRSKDALQREHSDPRAGEASKIPQRSTAETRRPRRFMPGG